MFEPTSISEIGLHFLVPTKPRQIKTKTGEGVSISFYNENSESACFTILLFSQLYTEFRIQWVCCEMKYKPKEMTNVSHVHTNHPTQPGFICVFLLWSVYYNRFVRSCSNFKVILPLCNYCAINPMKIF